MERRGDCRGGVVVEGRECWSRFPVSKISRARTTSAESTTARHRHQQRLLRTSVTRAAPFTSQFVLVAQHVRLPQTVVPHILSR